MSNTDSWIFALTVAPLVLIGCTDHRPAETGTAVPTQNILDEPTEREPNALDGARTHTSKSIGLKFVLVSAGEFEMGSRQSPEEVATLADVSVANWVGEFKHEHPLHFVRITSPFYLSKYETSQLEFEKVMGFNPSWYSPSGRMSKYVVGLNTSNFPVEQVNWFDAVEFCNRLSEKDGFPAYYRMTKVVKHGNHIEEANVITLGGSGYRLPTEAEWEYACRAQSTTPFHFGAANNGRHSNISGDFPYPAGEHGPVLVRPTTVGSYEPNGFDLCDMHGNVEEWCWDWYDKGFYSQSPRDDPTGPEEGTARVLRGGCWVDRGALTRAASRRESIPLYHSSGIGLRIAKNQ